MFIGHFAVGLAAKKWSPKVNLGFSFMACQLLDLIWPVLVLIGIEKVHVDPLATKVTPFDFEYYPYSHSLVMTILYSGLIGFLAFRIYKNLKSALVLGFVVLSHWILDFITHRPDLPIFLGKFKLGLGLWNSVLFTFFVEVGMYILGVWIFLRSTPHMSKMKKIGFAILIGFLFVVYLANLFGPKPPIELPSSAIAAPALSMWLIVLWGYWVDKKQPKEQ